eukprot:Gb_01288 [translate_table: standard]
MKFVSCFWDSIPVVAVHHKDKPLGIYVIMLPKRPNSVLTSNIPHSEVDVLILYSLHIETNGGNGCHNLIDLKLVQNSCFACSIQAQHHNSCI